MNDLERLVEDIKQTRDELNLKAHLFKADAKDVWQEMENKWAKINQTVKPTIDAAKDASKNINEANKLLLTELKNGYKHIKDTMD